MVYPWNVKLYVMRHGPAEDFASTGRDSDRALTPHGRDRVTSVAAFLREHGEQPRAIVTSPLVRALQTAELVAKDIGLPEVETRWELKPGGDSLGLVDVLLEERRKRTMLVGHQPDLGDLVETLLRDRLGSDMLKAMVVGLSVERGHPARLRFIVDPKTLQFLTPG